MMNDTPLKGPATDCPVYLGLVPPPMTPLNPDVPPDPAPWDDDDERSARLYFHVMETSATDGRNPDPDPTMDDDDPSDCYWCGAPTLASHPHRVESSHYGDDTSFLVCTSCWNAAHCIECKSPLDLDNEDTCDRWSNNVKDNVPTVRCSICEREYNFYENEAGRAYEDVRATERHINYCLDRDLSSF